MSELELESGDAEGIRLPIAGPGARSYAFIIDWHLRALFAFAWWFASSLLLSLAGRQNLFDALFEGGTRAVWIVWIPAAAIYFLYHPVLEILGDGRTPGKRFAGVRVVSQAGHSAGPMAHLIRNIFRILDSFPGMYAVGLVSTLLTQHHVRIGDLAAGTLLVHESAAGRAPGALLRSFATDSRLSPALRELLDELIERWPMLTPEVRLRAARNLLQKIGDPSEGDEPTLLARLRARANLRAGGA